ncbi:MAG: type II toxin-antitoxin system ParD family antitoxin [Pseudomonadota bacterium]
MSRLTISLPDQMSDWVSDQVSAGRYGNVSEYFRDLVRRDQEQRRGAIDALRDMLEQAHRSGKSDKDFDAIRAAAHREANQKGLLDRDTHSSIDPAIKQPREPGVMISGSGDGILTVGDMRNAIAFLDDNVELVMDGESRFNRFKWRGSDLLQMEFGKPL